MNNIAMVYLNGIGFMDDAVSCIILFDTYRINECCVSHGCCKVYK